MSKSKVQSGPGFNVERKTSLLERAIAGAGISVTLQDADLRYQYAENLPDHLSPSPGLVGMDDRALFGETDGARLLTAKRAVLEQGDPASVEVECRTPDGLRIYELKLERAGSGRNTGVLTFMSEVTDVRHRERVLKSLLRELSHRSKNLLAIIQGIATQTARHTVSLDYFLVKFRGRLQSLSNSQDLITDSSWRGAFLFELAEKQIAPYWPEGSPTLDLRGLNAHLTPNAAVHVGLALHELIVNSVSNGALSAGATSILLACRKLEIDGREAIEISWQERLPDNRREGDFEDRNFGRIVLERVVPASINGTAHFTVSPTGIDYRLTLPDTEFELMARR